MKIYREHCKREKIRKKTKMKKARNKPFICRKEKSQVILGMEVNRLGFCHRMFSLSKI